MTASPPRPRPATPDDINEHLEYLGPRGRDLSPGTIYQRRRHLVRLHAVVGKNLLDVDVDDITRWHSQLDVGVQARVTSIAHVSEFYKWAARQGYVTGDPTRFIIRPRVPRGLPRPISEQDLQMALDTAPRRIRPWLALAAYAGLRAVEIANLRRDAVLDGADPPVLVIHGKGGRDRVVPMGPALLLELQSYGLPTRGYVFTRSDGQTGPNKPWLVSHLANDHLHSLGISATLHQLRHRYGTQIYGLSQDIRVTQELMGHSSPSTTGVYAAYSKASAVAAARALDASLATADGQTTLPLDVGAIARPRSPRRRAS